MEQTVWCGVGCGSWAPGLQEAREGEQALWQGVGGEGGLYGIITRKKKSFDFYTAPDCWKRKSDVFNKYPKFFFGTIRFFFLTEKGGGGKPINFGISFTTYQNTATVEISHRGRQHIHKQYSDASSLKDLSPQIIKLWLNWNRTDWADLKLFLQLDHKVP